MIKIIPLVVGIAASIGIAHADITGKVIGVADGDTITVLSSNNQQIKVRFLNIDAPESSQSFGQRAKQNLSDYVFNKTVTVKGNQIDRYGRLLGTVYVDEININLKQVNDGMAWAYRQYLNDSRFITIESQARMRKKGLWAEDNPVAPWNYRHP